MNRGQIKTLASNFCEDPQQTRFSGLYDDAINRGQEQFAMDSKALYKDASTITVAADDASYDLPTDFMYEKKVTHKGIALEPISRSTLEFYTKTQDWSVITGTPKKFVIDPEEARKQILLYPIPQGDDAGANLIITYYPLPAEMTADTDTPLNSSSLMIQFHIGIAAYTAWLLLGNVPSTPEVANKRSDLMKQYMDKVTEAIDTFGNTKSAPIRMKGGRYW